MRFALVFVVAMICSACGGAQVDIRNRSSAQLRDVTITATADSAKISVVESMSEQRTSICPKGETGAIQVSFTANGQAYRSDQPLYFECSSSYAIKVDVSPSFEVSAVASLK